ncbi:uracil phosphoribosyltransferase [Rhizoctonia solani AG-1 IB]|uniref:uracil phosphoribosyltransferase n=2 Tax=Thanatephorus cucumeris (strain AG1-IB / isolate 7/3/14) TaxID=1108050 RepID=A0A0B7FL98_THACB|nr:uracil phosphoribosyltransferase [Rhizoctonia solani AG-1 IB]
MSTNNVHVLSHPLVNAKMAVLRDANTNAKEFREGVRDLTYLVAIEASRDLEEKQITGNTPVSEFVGSTIKPRVGIVPILRAGLGMTDAMLSLFPTAPVYHIGLFREKVSLQPVEYYSKLPKEPTVDQVFVVDPLIATGGTAIAAVHMILDWGIPLSKIKFLGVLASQAGLDHVKSEFPELEIWFAAVDPELTSNGLIKPGLGDTGDRLYSTTH